MAHKNFNIIPNQQTLFGSGDDFGGWEFTSGSGTLTRIDDRGFYPTYVPGDRPGYAFVKNTLMMFSDSTTDVVIKSPWVKAKPRHEYLASIYVAVNGTDANVKLDFEVSPTSSGTGETYATNSDLSLPISLDFNNDGKGLLFQRFTTLSDTSYVRMVLTWSGQGSYDMDAYAGLFMYDPVICEDSIEDLATFSKIMYLLLPAFMQLDDDNIGDFEQSGIFFTRPLLRLVEALTAPAAEIADFVTDFDYTRATEGVESKSTLTDPDTTPARFLGWLASVTGTNLLTAGFNTGFTPWAAFANFDWDDFDLIDSIDTSDDSVPWTELENFSVDFFDAIKGYRDQIRTGFTGLNAGRRDAIVAYTRTQIQSVDAATDIVVVSTEDKGSPYRVEMLVDPNVDPDPTGTQLVDSVNSSMVVGGVASKTNQVMEAARGAYDFSSSLYPATEANSSSGGVVYYGKSFFSDVEGFGRHILLNDNGASALPTSASVVPELGGGVGTAHYRPGAQYFYGDISSTSYGSLVTAADSECDLGGSTAGFDIIAIVSDLSPPSVGVDTAGSGGSTPADWLFRRKRLLVSGQDSGGSDNDWAVYVVSGLTPGSDTDTRLLFIEGYNTQNATNYAYSDPLNVEQLNHGGEFALRVSRSALDGGNATVSFYAQRSLYDDWSTNLLGDATTITPVTASAGADAQIQVLGEISGSGGGSWADSGPASCAVSRVMVFNTPLVFTGDSDTSSTAHAYVGGGATTTYGYYTYVPSVDIDVDAASVYATSFNAVKGGLTNLSVTVNEASSNDLDVLAMRRISGTTDFWYYGHAASGGDTLSVSGLNSSTSHDLKVTVYTVADGTESEYTHSVSTNGSGVLTINAQDTYTGSTTYAGSSIKQISVEDTGTEVAKFLPTTIAVANTTGTDALSKTWTLTRSYPANTVAYAPSQLVNKEFIQLFEGSPRISNPPQFETHMPFSVVMKLRRFWDSGRFDIFKLHNSESEGLTVYFEDDYIKASFKEGEDTERVEWQEASYGDWHLVIVRRDPQGNFSLVVDGTEQDSIVVSPRRSVFTTPLEIAVFSEGAASTWNSRFGLSEFGFFDFYLTDAQITLLNSQIS